MTHHTDAERAEFEAWLAARRAPVGAVPKWDGAIKPADFIVDTFRRGGSGWVPKPDTCVRITHCPTGFFEEETAMRSVHANKAVAWQRLSDRLEALAAVPQPPEAPTVKLPSESAGWFKWDKISQCWHPQYSEYAETYAKVQGWQKLYTEQQVIDLLKPVGVAVKP